MNQEKPSTESRNPRVYDEEGKIKDVDVAHDMAKLADPLYKKKWGFFSPSEKKIEEGMKSVENKIRWGYQEIPLGEVPANVMSQLEKVKKSYPTTEIDRCNKGENLDGTGKFETLYKFTGTREYENRKGEIGIYIDVEKDGTMNSQVIDYASPENSSPKMGSTTDHDL